MLPRLFGAHAIDRRDEILIRDGVRGLFEFPEVFGEAGDRGRRIEDDFGAVQAENARALGKMAVVADVDADSAEARLENGIAGVARREIKFLPEARMAVRDVMLAIFAEILPSASNTAAVLKNRPVISTS